MRLRPTLALALLVAASSAPARAATTDRIALEQLTGETPTEVALAYLEACLRLGAAPDNIRPVQTFRYADKPFVRLEIEGPSHVLRCLNTLSGRDAIDGTIHWLDGSSGGLLLSSAGTGHEVVVPEAQWYSVEGGPIVLPKIDEAFVDELLRGSAASRDRLRELPLDAALTQLNGLVMRGGPQAQAALELIASSDPRWAVRRSALLALDPNVSAQTILERSRRDEAWQVRLAAVDQVRNVALSTSQRSDDASALLLKIAREDRDWSVQRQAIWSMPSAQVRDSDKALMALVTQEGVDSRVRAIALEVLGGVGKASRTDLRKALKSPLEDLRAVAAQIVINEMKAADAPFLWAALNDNSRVVRIAAAPFLYRVDDPTLGPVLWPLYQHEADLIDADPEFEQALLDALARHPYAGLGDAMAARLARGGLSPDELRLLTRAFARVEPKKASALLEPDLKSGDLLKRSIAADATPDTPAAHARRLEFLSDPDGRLRASAILGLCRSSPQPLSGLAASADLGGSPLEQEARTEAARCGESDNGQRFATRLNKPAERPVAPRPNEHRWPALLGMFLFVVHVLVTKISAARRIPATQGPPDVA